MNGRRSVKQARCAHVNLPNKLREGGGWVATRRILTVGFRRTRDYILKCEPGGF